MMFSYDLSNLFLFGYCVVWHLEFAKKIFTNYGVLAVFDLEDVCLNLTRVSDQKGIDDGFYEEFFLRLFHVFNTLDQVLS